MIFLRLWHSWFVAFALVKASALLVPRVHRAEWLAEWMGELWCVGRACGLETQRGWHGEKAVTAFCAGAFRDALAVRSCLAGRGIPGRIAKRLEPGSPLRCMSILGGLLSLSLMYSVCAPQVRRAVFGAPAHTTDSLVLVSRDGYLGDSVPTVSLDEYRSWKASKYSFSSKMIFYRPLLRGVRFRAGSAARLRVAYASENMLSVLAPSLLPRRSRGAIVSRRVWRRYLQSVSSVRGQTIRIAGQEVSVLSVAPEQSWPVPGEMDVILLESDSALATLPSGTAGFVLAPGIEGALRKDDLRHSYLLATQASGSVARYECASLAQRRLEPRSLFLFVLLLACLALPATTPLPLGDYPANGSKTRRTPWLRRWAFLPLKLLLAGAATYTLSLSIAYTAMSIGSPPAEYFQMLSGFCGLLFAMRWAIRDQRRRCPTCLRLLSQPAHVGHPSRSFLAWHGTEMVCSVGHGLLYIPEHPTSWCSTQRWQALDPSWASFFHV